MTQTKIEQYHKIDGHQASHYQSTFFVHERTTVKANIQHSPLAFELTLGQSRLVIHLEMSELDRFKQALIEALSMEGSVSDEW
jgi:hypothetical protein